MDPRRPNRFFKHFFSYFLAAIFLVASFGVGLLAGEHRTSTSSNQAQGEVNGVGKTPDYLSKDVDFQLFWDAWKVVQENYVDQPVNQNQLMYGAIAGLVDSLKDPHSNYFTPDVNQAFLQELSGSFFGIGAEIAIKNDQLQIVAPLPDSPAEKAGLRAGDYIIKINDEDALKMTLDEAVSKIRGPQGSTVKLTVFRQGDKEPRDITITRDQVKIESVSYKKLDNNIGLIKLRYFNEDTAGIFNKIANQIVADNPSYLILDERNNPGGFLDSAVEIGSNFIDAGKVIVSERAADGSITEHKSAGPAKLKNFKLIVLLNEGSASASEILAGALKDYGLAKIVGMKSYGKGSVQTLFDLKDGSSIKLTIAKWLMPKGGTIEGVGIEPDVKVDLTEADFNADRDPQLDKALEIIKSEK